MPRNMSPCFSWTIYLALFLRAAAASSKTSACQMPHFGDEFISTELFSLPMGHVDVISRSNGIIDKRERFLYGPSICGNVSYWPTGSLGNSRTESDLARFLVDSQHSQAAVKLDETAAGILIAAEGIKKLSDYQILYQDQWNQSIPSGIDQGILTNYTNDLMFSMERLSVNPYSIKRLQPSVDTVPFQVEEMIACEVANTTVQSLFESGNLFYVDHRYQSTLQRTDRYAAACDAYFYIHPTSGDFLPLAIRSNMEVDLVYTPADSVNDWLLAKMMFNLNDFWHSQWYHLSGTHNVIEIVYEAAYRSLSREHPVMALLDRLTPELFAYRQAALEVLLKSGGYIDRFFAFSGNAGAQTTSDLYKSGISSAFRANYFHENLASRGLINTTHGSRIKHFPFFEDASIIHTAIEAFMTTFIDSYYTHPSMFTQDEELQAWMLESVPADIIDFPKSADRRTLIDILTHIAFLGSAVHQTLNTNDISEASGSLPFHPFALYQPIPIAKGVKDIIPFLPNITQSIGQIGLTALFARPEYVNSNRSLTQMFNDGIMLARMNKKTAEAARLFQVEMKKFSKLVSSRTFDAHGLCQGMPFIWKALDPERSPYYLTI